MRISIFVGFALFPIVGIAGDFQPMDQFVVTEIGCDDVQLSDDARRSAAEKWLSETFAPVVGKCTAGDAASCAVLSMFTKCMSPSLAADYSARACGLGFQESCD